MFAFTFAITWCRLALQTPLTTLVIFVGVSLVLKETYPFSHFPMYSSPRAARFYYLVTDSGGQPLPIATLTGITPPKIGKMHARKRHERSSVPDKAGENDAERDYEIGREICMMLREQAARQGNILPRGIQLVRVEIRYHDGKLEETSDVLFAE
jgi:hypothetical protein